MKLRITSLLIIIVMIFAVISTGCTAALKYGKDIPFDNPGLVLEAYFASMVKADYSTAYDSLSIETKKGFTETEFIDLQNLYAQSSYTFKRASVIVDKENMLAVDSIRYASAYEYTCKLDYLNGLTGKTSTEEMKYYVVAEDNQWKVHLPNPKIAYQNFLVYAYTRLGIMYSSGTNGTVDKAKALDYFKIVLTYSKDNSVINTYAALACLDLGKYDDALAYLAVAEKKVVSDNDKINIMCIKAAVYAKTGKIDEANALFDQAQKLEDSLPTMEGRIDFVSSFRAKYIPK
jgi:tetratricopeptide (TPR) repeat protein